MTARRHLFRGSLPVAVCALLGLASYGEDLKSHQCYQDFSSAYGQVKQNIPVRYGNDWKMESLPPEIVTELEWITKTTGKLQSDSDSLDSRAFALHTDDSELESAETWLKTRMATLDGKKRDLDNRVATWNRKVADLVARGQRHNANRCKAKEDVYQQVCGAYDAEARSLDAEGAQLQAQEKPLQQEEADLRQQQANLEAEAGTLASRRTALDQRRASLDSDVAAYMPNCEEATQRSRALAEILGTHPAERPRESKPDSGAAVMKAYGREAVVEAFKHFVLDTEAPGIALSVMDVVGSGMDERSKEVANNTYLLGEYASALQRLKKEGRLRPGDKGYDAIEHMVAAVGKDMPGSNAEFTWESLTSLHTMVDGMAAAGGHYASKQTEHLGNEIMKHVSKEEKQVLGRKGVAFFRAMLNGTISAGSNLTTEQALKLPYEAIKEQKQKAAEHKAQNP
jgi:hypothetical protein